MYQTLKLITLIGVILYVNPFVLSAQPDSTLIRDSLKNFSLKHIYFNIGNADKLVGPGGLRIQTQGNTEITTGIKHNKTTNPALSEYARNRTFFNFDEKIQLNAQVAVGSKVNFRMNYDTERLASSGSQDIKFTYTGEEDDILKLVEAGNLSMYTSNSLINGAENLFGIQTLIQLGNLKIKSLFSQQQTNLNTIPEKETPQSGLFELTAQQYEANCHFFLAHYFCNTYNEALSKLPYISSPITINRIEVWVSHRQNSYEQNRNVVAFTDLAEHQHITYPACLPSGNVSIPHNGANTLYTNLINKYPEAREIHSVSQAFSALPNEPALYEKIEGARKLDESEYILNRKLGYISLNTPLQSNEILAVAYAYSYKGTTYQVGEFASDLPDKPSACLFVKLLKARTFSPYMPQWHLMMKNVYSPGNYIFSKDNFHLDILYLCDTIGTTLNYLPEGNLKGELLLRVMNLDRINKQNASSPDAVFDFVEGYTIQADKGRIIFPVTEPFGSYLYEKIKNPEVAGKYAFQSLYDSTQANASNFTEKNKFILRGRYTSLQTNSPPGFPEQISSSQKLRMGMDITYTFNKNLNFGATLMRLSEKPLYTKTSAGNELISNTLWGVNSLYHTESRQLTSWLNEIPLLSCSLPSRILFSTEFAKLVPGQSGNNHLSDYSYLDDFENTQSTYSLLNPQEWTLSSIPTDNSPGSLFPEATLTHTTETGKNRALLAWYTIDEMFTQRNASLMPAHLKNDKEQLSDHRVRAVYSNELHPDKDIPHTVYSALPILNLAFYPAERGPYNLDTENINTNGMLTYPEKRWGGIMRNLYPSDFEKNQIEYITFWLMDPFIQNHSGKGGDLYLNLGEVSEDILKDGKKFFENGISINGHTASVNGIWGKEPEHSSSVYAFDSSTGTHKKQDAGLNGLTSKEEMEYPTYLNYLSRFRKKLSSETIVRMQNDLFSPLNDPAGDNYHHYRGKDFDQAETDILNRYKYYNGTEGNSPTSQDSPETYNTAATLLPDIEDLNQNNTLDESEKYYQYKISIRPKDSVIGYNYITDKRVVRVKLENQKEEDVTWYQFRIPIAQYEKQIGSIRDFRNIGFMRLFLTGFSETTILRFGSFELVSAEWKKYTHDLYNSRPTTVTPAVTEVSAVSIEENKNRIPVNYILPPDVSRIVNPKNKEVIQENEQALAIKVTDLASGDACAVYKNIFSDLRLYQKLQMFVHAEALINDVTDLTDNELSIFIRLGSDMKHNYYEYEVPLTLTPHRVYAAFSNADQQIVWHHNNRIDLQIESFTNLKLKRNKLKQTIQSNISLQAPYTENDPENPFNRISILGNPSLSEIKGILIGIRNHSGNSKSGEVWVNELRLTKAKNKGGQAANSSMEINLSDLGSVSINGKMQTSGFGSLDQSWSERSLNNEYLYNISTQLELGKLFPAKANVSIPFCYNYTQANSTPEYNPFDQDILLNKALSVSLNKSEYELLKQISRTRETIKSISFTQVQAGIRSKQPMPYDPANFSIGYNYNEHNRQSPNTEYERIYEYRGYIDYTYTPERKSFYPFKNLASEKINTFPLKKYCIYYLPTSISFQTNMMRIYTETQLRDLVNTTSSTPIPASFNQDFSWNRAFNLDWVLTSNFRTTFKSGTNARIEEPYVQVNKELYPEAYNLWRDSVMHSIAHLGTPLKYGQEFSAFYQLPFRLIPHLNWIHASILYHAAYTWNNDTLIKEHTETGNTITNQQKIDFTGKFMLDTFYDKLNVTPSSIRQLHHFLTMVRTVDFAYSKTKGTQLAGFLPQAGDISGQQHTPLGMAPGIQFAFGFDTGYPYINKARQKGWITKDENTLPALISQAHNFTIRTLLTPLSGLKINLTANQTKSINTEIYAQFPGIPPVSNGNLTRTTLAIQSIFNRNDRYSETFNTFLNNRYIIAKRLKTHSSQINSPDILIPAFLLAYTNGKANLLPNWKITYNGSNTFPFIKKHVKSIHLSHEYRCSYTTIISSSNIAAVNISEGFYPLIGIDFSFFNNLTARMAYKYSRNLNLSNTSFQLTETLNKETIIGTGYKLSGLNIMPKKNAGFTNEIALQIELAFAKTHTIIRQTEKNQNLPVNGNNIHTIRCSVNYTLSSVLTFRAFYDLQVNKPLISAVSFVSSQSNSGVSLRFTIN